MPARLSRTCLLFTAVLLVWTGTLLLSCFLGNYPLEASAVLDSLKKLPSLLLQGDHTTFSPADVIVLDIRLARALLALLIGGALSVAGVLLQATLRNRLADPFTLGISQGAAFGASLALTTISSAGIPFLDLLSQTARISLAAFCGAVLATLATLSLGCTRERFETATIILAGIAVATFLGSLVALIKALNEESVTSIVFWIMGSFQGRSWESLPVLLVPLVPALLCLPFFWRACDMLLLHDEQAQQMGLDVARTRFCAVLLASLLTAGSVAVAGVIGFVGLVVPHILRLLLGAAHGPLLAASFFGGGILLLVSDILARTILPDGQELPVGVVTALIGGPFFACLIRIRNRHA